MSNIEIVNSKSGEQYIVIPAKEGTFENDDFEVLVSRKVDPVLAAIERLESTSLDRFMTEETPVHEPIRQRFLGASPDEPRRSWGTEFRGYAVVRQASFGESGGRTKTTHAAVLYSDDSVGKALCDRTANRKTYRQKKIHSSEVECKRCRGHLEEIGVITEN